MSTFHEVLSKNLNDLGVIHNHVERLFFSNKMKSESDNNETLFNMVPRLMHFSHNQEALETLTNDSNEIAMSSPETVACYSIDDRFFFTAKDFLIQKKIRQYHN